MRTPHLLSVVAMLVAVPSLARAAELDPATGAFRFSSDALGTLSFDEPAVSSGLTVTGWSFIGGTKVVAVDGDGVVVTDGALEGTGAFRIGDLGARKRAGVAWRDTKLFATLADKRIVVTAWVRTETLRPVMALQYGKPDWKLDNGPGLRFAVIAAIPTGRATSDGWLELSSGPVDGSVLGVPLRMISVVPLSNAQPGDSGLVDALEIRPAPGVVMGDVACTLDDVDTTCGATGDCVLGRCVPDSVTWGPLPSADMRQEYGEWLSHVMSRLHGDRPFAAAALATMVPQAKELEASAVGSRAFFGKLSHIVSALRDNHTSMPSNPAFNAFTSPTAMGYQTSMALGGCFAEAELDVLGGGRGYAINRIDPAGALTGVPLQIGDVLTSIDGAPVDTWLAKHLFDLVPASSSDAAHDPAAVSLMLGPILSTHASKITITRCASAACTGADRTILEIPVADKMREDLLFKGTTSNLGIACSTRFHDAVAAYAPFDGVNDHVYLDTSATGDLTIEFDGFASSTGIDSSRWQLVWSTAFSSHPGKALIDARLGHGGALPNLNYVFQVLRPKAQPLSFVLRERAGWDAIDDPRLFDERCTATPPTVPCLLSPWGTYHNDAEDPGGGTTKVAWLMGQAVSANDFAPRVLQGRTDLRIFGPHASSGAFGNTSALPPALPGWGASQIQAADARFASAPAGFAAARWESQHGVVPDVVVTQQVSDLLRDHDTLIDAARAWLGE